MTNLDIFLWSFCGSIAIEILDIYTVYKTNSSLPERYKKVFFWIIRTGLAIIAGGLAIVYEASHRLKAVSIGAAAPLILGRLAQGVNSASK